MHTSDQAHRVIFIDLMRAIAVLQMVQGHTIDVLLAPDLELQNHRFLPFGISFGE